MPDFKKIMKQIEEEGFSLDEINRSELTIAFLSLRTALRAWFSTYQCFRWRFYIADINHSISPPVGIGVQSVQFAKLFRQQNHPFQYYEAYSETILHFHHFFELILKDILRAEHELLTNDASGNPLILFQLLKGEKVDLSKLQPLKSVEFGEALKRVVCLINNNKLDQTKYGYIKTGSSILEKLNWFRNRLIHRGTFVLPYAALDEFIGKFLLPIIVTSLQLPQLVGKENFWQYQPLICGIDPLLQLHSIFQAHPINFKKVAFVKELGRAAFDSPIQKRGTRIDEGDQARAETIAKFEFENGETGIYDVLNCPVCGSKSLVRFFDIGTENPDSEDPGKAWLKTVNVECYCCSFKITEELSNASQVGLPIEDYWTGEELSN